MRRIPPSTHPEVAAQAEQTLASAARRFDPAALGRITERLLAHLDPDGNAPTDEPETMRELRVRSGADGTVSLTGKLDPEGGARVLEVLGSLNNRRPPVDGVPDPRSQARRDANALVEAMTSLLDEGELPSRGGQRLHLVLTMRLSNMCLLCKYHHVIVHRQGWHIRLDRRGRPEFLPPRTVDTTRTPLHDPIRQ